MLQRDHGGTDKREQGFGSKPTTSHSYTEGQRIWDGATLNKSEFEIYQRKFQFLASHARTSLRCFTSKKANISKK